MCLAIYKPAGARVKLKRLRVGFANNDDGAGLAWFDGREVWTAKGFFSAEEFVEAYRKVERFACLIHCRTATSGGISADLCHPFAGEGWAAIHNGILAVTHQPNESDTAAWCRDYLAPMLRWGHADDSVIRDKLERSIGLWNKVAILDYRGHVTILNEAQGHWSRGVWYSNHDYQPRRLGIGYHWRFDRTRADDGADVRDWDYWPEAEYRGRLIDEGTEWRCQTCGTDLLDFYPMADDRRCPYCGDVLPVAVGRLSRGGR